MGKKKSFEDEVRRMEHKEKCAQKIHTVVEWVIFAVGIGCFALHWKLGIGAIVFFLWSEYWYAHGCEKWVTDEHEQGGYPTEGLRTMFISWIFFAAAVALIVFFFL